MKIAFSHVFPHDFPMIIPLSLSALVLSIPGRSQVPLQLELNRVGSSRAFVAA